MRFLFLCLVGIQFSHVQAMTFTEQQKWSYANIYADALIEEFDKQLDQKVALQDTGGMLYEEVYSRLLSARYYIDKVLGHRGGNGKNNPNILMVTDTGLYQKVVKAINKEAIKIHKKRNELKETTTTPVIYPSATRAGNITGNSFPSQVWTLTFDDGPRNGRTQTVVDNLYNRNMRATFFMPTRQALRFESVANYVKNADMEIAHHSYTHPNLTKLNAAELEYEVTTAKKDLEELLNVELKLMRLPYGAGLRNSKVRKKIATNNMVHVFWNVDTLDWKDKNPSSIKARTLKQMQLSPKDSGIILFHDIHAQTVIASEMVMDHLQDNNYTVCTVQQVVDFKNGLEQDCL
jgi:peptidoglycan/xylan/chitin deacetylase (PgdA/CDA1 family)